MASHCKKPSHSTPADPAAQAGMRRRRWVVALLSLALGLQLVGVTASPASPVVTTAQPPIAPAQPPIAPAQPPTTPAPPPSPVTEPAHADTGSKTGDSSVRLIGPADIVGGIKLNHLWEFYWQKWIPPKTQVPTASNAVQGTNEPTDPAIQNAQTPAVINQDAPSEQSGPVGTTGAFDKYQYAFDEGPLPKPLLIAVPGTWRGLQLPNGTELPGTGFATYRTVLQLSKEAADLDLGLRVADVGTAYRLYINGVPAASQGQLGRNLSESTPRLRPVYLGPRYMKPDSTGRVELVLHISNFHDKTGGIWGDMRLTTLRTMFRNAVIAVITSGIAIGCLFFFFAYHLGLFIYRSKEYGSALIALVSLLVLVRTLVTDERFLYYIPSLTYSFNFRLEYIVSYLIPAVFTAYMVAVFPGDFSKTIARIYYVITALLMATVLLFEPAIFTELLIVFHVCAIAVALWVIGSLLRAAFLKRKGSRTLLISFLVFFVAALVDVLHSQMVISDYNLISFGLVGYIFGQGLVLSSRFADSFQKIENYSKDLETAVNTRTRELNEAMLRLSARSEDIEMQLSYSRDIQDSWQQKNRPEIEGYDVAYYTQFYEKIGGDIIWWHSTGDEHYFAVGDVSGHGVPAAIITAILETSFELTDLSQISLATLVSELDRLVQLKGGPGFFATLIVARLNSRTHKLDFVNCGHNSPYHINGSKPKPINPRSIPVGLGYYTDGSVETKMVNLTLDRSDVWFAYTDGLTEATDRDNEMYGEGRLEQVLGAGYTNPDLVFKAITADIEEFGGRLTDDLTLFYLRRKK